MIAPAIAIVVWTKIAAEYSGNMCQIRIRQRGLPDSASPLDVLLLFDHKHPPAGKARENGSLHNSDRNNRIGQVRPRKAVSSPKWRPCNARVVTRKTFRWIVES